MSSKRDWTLAGLYKVPVERRPLKHMKMSPKPWIPAGESAAPVKVFSDAERAAWEAANTLAPPVKRRPPARPKSWSERLRRK